MEINSNSNNSLFGNELYDFNNIEIISKFNLVYNGKPTFQIKKVSLSKFCDMIIENKYFEYAKLLDDVLGIKLPLKKPLHLDGKNKNQIIYQSFVAIGKYDGRSKNYNIGGIKFPDDINTSVVLVKDKSDLQILLDNFIGNLFPIKQTFIISNSIINTDKLHHPEEYLEK